MWIYIRLDANSYSMGEIKDKLSFYYSEEEYSIFLMFFAYLRGSTRFSYERYETAYSLFHDDIVDSGCRVPAFCENKDLFLQLLYNLNIICYIDNTSRREFFYVVF